LREINHRVGARLADDIRQVRAGIQESVLQLRQQPEKRPKPGHLSPKDCTDRPASIVLRINNTLQSVSSIATALTVLQTLGPSRLNRKALNVSGRQKETWNWSYLWSVRNWLKSTDCILWIVGEIGSGKSTLIVFLKENPETHLLLRHWSGPRKVKMLRYSFDSTSTKREQSLRGLLQAIVFDLLRVLLEDLTASHQPPQNSSEPYAYHDHSKADWTFEELLRTLVLFAQTRESSSRFFICIDDLDDFQGDHAAFCSTLETIALESNIKFCISVKSDGPTDLWNWHEQFCHMHIKDLTRPAIAQFVDTALSNNRRFQGLKIEPAESDEMIEEIVEMSQGVFLWAHCMVGLLAHHLHKHRDATVLSVRQCIQSTPENLSQLLRTLLPDQQCQQKIGIALNYVLCSEQAPALLSLWYLGKYEADPNFALAMSMANNDKAKRIRAREMFREDQMRRLVKGQSKGLLKVSRPIGATRIGAPPGRQRKVDFPHRIFKDYFLTTEGSKLLNGWLPVHFEVEQAICMVALAQLKEMQLKHVYFSSRGPVTRIIEDIFCACARHEVRTGRTFADVVLELDRTVKTQMRHWKGSGMPKTYPWKVIDGSISVVHFAVRSGLKILIRELVDLKHPGIGRHARREFAMGLLIDSPRPDMDMVQVLLGEMGEVGLNPVFEELLHEMAHRTHEDVYMMLRWICRNGAVSRDTFQPHRHLLVTMLGDEDVRELEDILPRGKSERGSKSVRH
jgi:hypothetical protein